MQGLRRATMRDGSLGNATGWSMTTASRFALFECPKYIGKNIVSTSVFPNSHRFYNQQLTSGSASHLIYE